VENFPITTSYLAPFPTEGWHLRLMAIGSVAAIPEEIGCGSVYRRFCSVAGVLRLRGGLKRPGFVRFREQVPVGVLSKLSWIVYD
jgi:hypothetical protein